MQSRQARTTGWGGWHRPRPGLRQQPQPQRRAMAPDDRVGL